MNEDGSRNPDSILAAITKEAARLNRGQLKVFLGMCPGVGKTFAMLKAAHRELQAGRDVALGYVETHGRKETEALLAGLPSVRRTAAEYRGVRLEEMDLDALLERRPFIAVVDELAHSNVPGSRHPKRWQDVQELLDAGISVLTTLNVQHVESRAETVRQITQAEIRETVPDSVLDEAELELVDLPPRELIQRLQEGKVYVPDRAAVAVQHYFRESSLTALRELALRLVADHVGEDTVDLRRSERVSHPWKTGNRLLVAVGPSPLSEQLIRWTRRMADELRCQWLAAHIEESRRLPEDAEARLAANLETARELGAEVITSTDDDIARGLIRVAREHNVTQIVFGKPGGSGVLDWWRNGRVMRRLIQQTGDVDVHVVRADKRSPVSGAHWKPRRESELSDYLRAAGIVLSAGLINLALAAVSGPRVPGLIFLLTVVLLALFVGRGPVFLAGAMSALAWNFFFLPPRFTLTIQEPEDAVLFGTYFVVALVLGQLVARIRTQSDAERRREARSRALYQLTRDLAEAGSRDQVVWHLIAQVDRVFQTQAAVCLPVRDHIAPHPDSTLSLNEKELGVAEWAFERRQPAGRTTGNLPGAAALHLPLATERKVFGVLSVSLGETTILLAQRDLLETFAQQAALVLDRIELRASAEQTRLLAESERFSRVLLNSISHELRTPLAAITTAATAMRDAENQPAAQRRALLAEIQQANARLNRIVGNLLDVARLESGKVVPRMDWHDVRDVIQTTLLDLQAELTEHPVATDFTSEPALARIDFTLTQHAFANLVLNASVHTPPGASIEVKLADNGKELALTVADRGPGIPPEFLPRIFEKFSRGPAAPAGGSGLGLTIAKGFIEAQGGRISAANRPGSGAIFCLCLPSSAAIPLDQYDT